MRSSGSRTKRFISLALCLAMLISAVAFALTVHAEDADIADTGADTYYLWGESSNSPNFNASAPTGTFTYDSSKGYYYYDLTGSSGDYCFVVSTIGNSASYAVKTPAVQTVQNAGSYYLSAGNYHGFNCMHLWNPGGDAIRIYFTSTSAGLNAVKAGSDATQAPTSAPQTQAPTQQPTSGGGTTPTSAPSTQAPTSSSDKRYVYCENEAGWSQVYAYLWNSNSDKNAEWPGVKMTNIGGNTWRYEVPKTFAKIIFNIGSNQTQTSDMTYPGDGYCYNNKTGEWTIYDTSPLHVTSFTTDLAAPQYNGVGITLSASAEGSGNTYYKFSVKYNNSTTVLQDFSTKNSVLWTPQTPGTYTLIYDYKDDAGITNQRTKEYEIKDGLTSVAPYIKTVTPAGGEILKSSSVNVNVTAGGGITGTNLLFYKFTVKNANGAIVNVPYYSLRSNTSFTPTATGAYTVTVSVQGSDNKVDERTYSYDCVTSMSPTEDPFVPTEPIPQDPTDAPTEAPTQKPTQAPPTQPPTQSSQTIIRGDADDDGEVTIFDVTYIQRYDLHINLPSPINLDNADADDDGDVTIIDATFVQRFLVGIIKSL